MAPETKTEEEPSIEEILDSIRQIISDDDEEEEAAAATPEPAPAEDHADDIIELTDPADEAPPAPVRAAPAPAPVPPPPPKPEPPPVAQPEPIPESEPVPEPEPEPEPEISAPEPVLAPQAAEEKPPVKEEKTAVSEEVESLLTKNAETAALGAFAELKKKTAIEPAGPTVEEIVRTELRPLLTHWLDKNLPSMVERLVREEIERVSKEAREE